MTKETTDKASDKPIEKDKVHDGEGAKEAAGLDSQAQATKLRAEMRKLLPKEQVVTGVGQESFSIDFGDSKAPKAGDKAPKGGDKDAGDKAAKETSEKSPEEKKVEDTARKVLKEADKDGDGHITKQELETYRESIRDKEGLQSKPSDKERVADAMLAKFDEMQKASRDDSKLGLRKEKGITENDIDSYSKKLVEAYEDQQPGGRGISPEEQKKVAEDTAKDVEAAAKSKDMSEVIKDVEQARETMNSDQYQKYLRTVTEQMQKAGILSRNQEVVGGGDGEIIVYNKTGIGHSINTHYDAKGNDVKKDNYDHPNLFDAKAKAEQEFSTPGAAKQAEETISDVASSTYRKNLTEVIKDINEAKASLPPDDFKKYIDVVDKQMHKSGVLPPDVHLDPKQYEKGPVDGIPVESESGKHSVLDAKGKETKGVKGIPDAFSRDAEGTLKDPPKDSILTERRADVVMDPFSGDAEAKPFPQDHFTVAIDEGEDVPKMLKKFAAAAIENETGEKPTEEEIKARVKEIVKANPDTFPEGKVPKKATEPLPIDIPRHQEGDK